MFYHVKELQFNARVSGPDPRFARLLLEQFGGCNGELKAAMQYFVQAFSCRKPYPDKYDMLMDIATEEFSHLEIVGATIQMLLTGVNGELKDVAESSELNQLMGEKNARDQYINEAMQFPHFYVQNGGGPQVTDSNGVPWSGSYVNANGDMSVDMRSNMAAESRAKIVYEYLMQFTDDPFVKESLRFLMTREVAHFQMFEAALETIQPNFPPGVLQSDPKHSNTYFNLSNGEEFRGPWNEGKSLKFAETWQYVNDPRKYIIDTQGLTNTEARGTERTEESVQDLNSRLSEMRSTEISAATQGEDVMQWSSYPDNTGQGNNMNSENSLNSENNNDPGNETSDKDSMNMENSAGSESEGDSEGLEFSSDETDILVMQKKPGQRDGDEDEEDYAGEDDEDEDDEETEEEMDEEDEEDDEVEEDEEDEDEEEDENDTEAGKNKNKGKKKTSQVSKSNKGQKTKGRSNKK